MYTISHLPSTYALRSNVIQQAMLFCRKIISPWTFQQAFINWMMAAGMHLTSLGPRPNHYVI